MSNQISHDSAVKHVTGQSVFIEDMPSSGSILHGRVFYSRHAHAAIKRIDLTQALLVRGVNSILTARDIPGLNQMGPIIHDEICLASHEVNFVGQAIALIAAENEEAAYEAEKLIDIEFQSLPAILNRETAMAQGNMIAPERKIIRGDVDAALKQAPNQFS